MSITGKITNLFADKAMTIPAFPRTKIKAVSDDNGVGLDAILNGMVHTEEYGGDIATAPVNADTLGGHPVEDFATATNVNEVVNGIKDDITEIKAAAPFSFGVDENGNYGYIKAGADSVTPFKLGKVTLLSVLTGGTGSTTPYELSYQFTEDYSQAFIVIMSNDTDNNGDNFYKVYSSQNSTIASSSYSNYWNVTDNEWDYFKPTLPSGISYPAANSKYTNEKDLNKDMYWATGTSGATSFACVAYKDDIKANDTAWMYLNFYRRGIAMIFGVK